MPSLPLIGAMAESEGPQLPWNTIVRVCLVALAASALLFLPAFVDHARAHVTGSIVDDVITGRWHVVVLNIAAFLAFLIPLTYRRKADWKEYSLVAAFFVSLFVEMYGIPLLIVFASKGLAADGGESLNTVLSVDFLGVTFVFTVPMIYGTVLILAGTTLIIVGWYQLYKGVQEEELVTTGVYAVSRNPQYLGFMLIIIGWLVGWPTILVLIFAPVLLIIYARLCKVEERELCSLPGYKEYRERVPLII
jgi:protein-S-isoprenylcysteine O-methyltransferase Ste14